MIWSNWPQYVDIDDEDGSFPTIEAFTAETGIEVEYIEDINDNTEFFGRIRPQLTAGQPIDRDLIVLTDWMAGRIIGLGWVQELTKENIPNSTNVIPILQDAAVAVLDPVPAGLLVCGIGDRVRAGLPGPRPEVEAGCGSLRARSGRCILTVS